MNRKKASGTSERAHKKPPASTIDATRNVPRPGTPARASTSGQERAEDHSAINQHVRHRDNRSATVGRRPPLQERIERNKEQPAEDPQKSSSTRSCRRGRARSRRRPARSTVRPSAPNGSRPYSTFDADSLPASKQPRPTPIPSAANGKPLCQSLKPQVRRVVSKDHGRHQGGDRPHEHLADQCQA